MIKYYLSKESTIAWWVSAHNREIVFVVLNTVFDTQTVYKTLSINILLNYFKIGNELHVVTEGLNYEAL